jgi:hypothetical protein
LQLAHQVKGDLGSGEAEQAQDDLCAAAREIDTGFRRSDLGVIQVVKDHGSRPAV